MSGDPSPATAITSCGDGDPPGQAHDAKQQPRRSHPAETRQIGSFELIGLARLFWAQVCDLGRGDHILRQLHRPHCEFQSDKGFQRPQHVSFALRLCRGEPLRFGVMSKEQPKCNTTIHTPCLGRGHVQSCFFHVELRLDLFYSLSGLCSDTFAHLRHGCMLSNGMLQWRPRHHCAHGPRHIPAPNF